MYKHAQYSIYIYTHTYTPDILLEFKLTTTKVVISPIVVGTLPMYIYIYIYIVWSDIDSNIYIYIRTSNRVSTPIQMCQQCQT